MKKCEFYNPILQIKIQLNLLKIVYITIKDIYEPPFTIRLFIGCWSLYMFINPLLFIELTFAISQDGNSCGKKNSG